MPVWPDYCILSISLVYIPYLYNCVTLSLLLSNLVRARVHSRSEMVIGCRPHLVCRLAVKNMISEHKVQLSWGVSEDVSIGF